MGRFVGFRLGKNDGDIEEDLKRFSNESARIREAYRLAMAVERGEYVKVTDVLLNYQPYKEPPKPSEPTKPPDPIRWEFPAEPTVKNEKPVDKKTMIRNNILGGF